MSDCDSDEEDDVRIDISQKESDDLVFSDLVSQSGFNNKLCYTDEPMPGPSTMASNTPVNDPIIFVSDDFFINEMVESNNICLDNVPNEVESRPMPRSPINEPILDTVDLVINDVIANYNIGLCNELILCK